MSHECRPSKRELWLKWKADQIFHQSPSIFRHKLASVVSGRLWLFCAFEAGECFWQTLVRIPGIRQLQQLEGSTSEATYGIPQLITSFRYSPSSMLKTSSWSMGRTQFRKKDSNQRSSPKTTHFEKKNIPKEKRSVQLKKHVPPKKHLQNAGGLSSF